MTVRKSPTKITPEIIQQLKELVEDGKSNKEISEILNIGTTTISTYKKKYNIKYIKSTAEDKREEIVKLYKEGMATKEIAFKLGYSSSTTIKNILNKENVKSHKDIEIEELKIKLIEVCPNCFSAYEVSKKLGCSVTTVKKYMEELNINLKVKYELSDKDKSNISINTLKYPFDSKILNIPEEDRKEFLTTKIKMIILEKGKYTGILVLKHHGIDTNYLNTYKISTEVINKELGLKRVNGSTLELYFSEFCELNDITIESQKTFSDCYYKEELRFDYFLPKYNILIEIQGKQHFEPVTRFGGENAFNDCVIRDNIKREWCKENNVKLIYISYRDLYKNNYLKNLFQTEIFPVAKYKLGELLETPEMDNQQPS